MPIYAYRCESCGHSMDALQKVSDAPLSDCPACGRATLRKQVTAAGFQLKGSGWYVTDFRGDGKAAKPAAEAAAPPPDAGGGPASGPASEKPAETKAADTKSAEPAAATPAAAPPAATS